MEEMKIIKVELDKAAYRDDDPDKDKLKVSVEIVFKDNEGALNFLGQITELILKFKAETEIDVK